MQQKQVVFSTFTPVCPPGIVKVLNPSLGGLPTAPREKSKFLPVIYQRGVAGLLLTLQSPVQVYTCLNSAI